MDVFNSEATLLIRLTHKVQTRWFIFREHHAPFCRALVFWGGRILDREPTAFRKSLGAYIALNLGTRLHGLTQFVPSRPGINLVDGRQTRRAARGAWTIFMRQLTLYSMTHKYLKKLNILFYNGTLV